MRAIDTHSSLLQPMWKTSAASREAKEEEEEKDMVEVKYLARHEGAEVTVAGWVDQLRVHGKVAFIVVRDGTGYVQGVLAKKEIPAGMWELAAALTQEATVEMTGVVREDARSRGATRWG